MTTDIAAPGLSDRERSLHRDLSARLAHLEKMGLAKSVASQQWFVRSDFETVLRTLQRTVDLQKMLAAHGALLSDPRLPFEITNIRNLKAMEGRILLHDEDEVNGRRYLLLESTDAKVRLIYQEIEEARRAGKLAVNTFARLQKRFIDGVPSINISDYGDANTLLKNHSFFAERAQSSSRDGTEAHYTTWGGWLGQYYARLQTSTQAERAPARSHQPRQKNSLGRG